jgi:hypothetical protein
MKTGNQIHMFGDSRLCRPDFGSEHHGSYSVQCRDATKTIYPLIDAFPDGILFDYVFSTVAIVSADKV